MVQADPRAFSDYLASYRNTICGRHPISVLLNVSVGATRLCLLLCMHSRLGAMQLHRLLCMCSRLGATLLHLLRCTLAHSRHLSPYTASPWPGLQYSSHT